MSKYKPGDKFVIEIEDVYEQGNPTLYRIKGFNSLVFDARGLNKVPQLIDGINPRSYDKGMEDAWELCRKIGSPKTVSDTNRMFAFMKVGEFYDILTRDVHEMKSMFEEWERRQTPGDFIEYEIRQQAYEDCCGSCPQARKCHEDCSEDECEKFTGAMLELCLEKLKGGVSDGR